MQKRWERAHDDATKREDGVREIRRPMAIATKANGEVWEVYANIGEVLADVGVSVWAVRRGAHPKKLNFVDFTLTEEGREAMRMWALKQSLDAR